MALAMTVLLGAIWFPCYKGMVKFHNAVGCLHRLFGMLSSGLRLVVETMILLCLSFLWVSQLEGILIVDLLLTID